jgi:hypothetical protein
MFCPACASCDQSEFAAEYSANSSNYTAGLSHIGAFRSGCEMLRLKKNAAGELPRRAAAINPALERAVRKLASTPVGKYVGQKLR